MTQVFISYSRRDLAFVEQLAADLKAAGLDVWYDLSGLEGGARWSREKRLRKQSDGKCNFYDFDSLADSVSSKWVRKRISLCRQEKEKKIVPII